MGNDETTDPAIKREARGTRDYDLEEVREASRERLALQSLHVEEKAAMTASYERLLRSKNYIIYAMLIANLFQAALLLGRSLGFSGGGVEITTDGDVDVEVPESVLDASAEEY